MITLRSDWSGERTSRLGWGGGGRPRLMDTGHFRGEWTFAGGGGGFNPSATPSAIQTYHAATPFLLPHTPACSPSSHRTLRPSEARTAPRQNYKVIRKSQQTCPQTPIELRKQQKQQPFHLLDPRQGEGIHQGCSFLPKIHFMYPHTNAFTSASKNRDSLTRQYYRQKVCALRGPSGFPKRKLIWSPWFVQALQS